MVAATKSSMMPVWSPDGSRLAFTSNRTGEHQVWVMDKDGGNQHRVTKNDEQAYFYPSWSPDGTQLTFQGLDQERVDYDIYTANVDTGEMKQLTSQPFDEEQPHWSPDGSKILYQGRCGHDGNSELFTVTPQGESKQLTPNGTDNFQATWSHDGSQIAFVSSRDTQETDLALRNDIFLADADGQNVTRVTNEGTDGAFNPAFSPDDSRLAYTWRRKDSEIAIINRDGSDRQVLTNLPATEDQWPEWAPDGQTIAFTSMHKNITMDIHTVGVNGGPSSELVNPAIDERLATFSPDGQTIAFSAHRDGYNGGEDIFAVDRDGSNLRRLTPYPEPCV